MYFINTEKRFPFSYVYIYTRDTCYQLIILAMYSLNKRSLSIFAAGLAMIGSPLAFAGTALAAGPSGFGHGMRPAVIGTVASAPDVNGTFTVTAKNWRRGTSATASPTTYTVTTANATVTKAGVASTVSAIAVGDMVMVKGTVSGTNVTATTILDGFARGRHGAMPWRKLGMGFASRTITGNGQPVIGGNVTAVNGNSLTVTNKSNVTYTVDVTSAIVSKKGVTDATISSIAVGDSVIVQGTVNGNSVTATSVVDQGTLPSTSSDLQSAPHNGGFMGVIGGFFSHFFGFF